MNQSDLATQKTDLANRQTGLPAIRNYMLSPEVRERFTQMMGRQAIYYLNQVLIVVGGNQDLQNCSINSILTAAMRAASLRLSVDPTAGQAWIIAYRSKNGLQASFQLGYRGVYELAHRTGKYRFINMIDVFEGEEVTQNRMTGMHGIGGTRTGDKVIGYMLYFQLVNGFEKTFYMTVEEIESHARTYAPAYNNPKSPWNDPVERPKMMKKTVLSNGLKKWGVFNEADRLLLDDIESASPFVALEDRLPDPDLVSPPAKLSEGEIMATLGFDASPVSATAGKTHTRDDAARDQAAAAAQPTEPEPTEPEPAAPSRADLLKQYSALAETALALGIQPVKSSLQWSDEKLAASLAALRDAVKAREPH